MEKAYVFSKAVTQYRMGSHSITFLLCLLKFFHLGRLIAAGSLFLSSILPQIYSVLKFKISTLFSNLKSLSFLLVHLRNCNFKIFRILWLKVFFLNIESYIYNIYLSLELYTSLVLNQNCYLDFKKRTQTL